MHVVHDVQAEDDGAGDGEGGKDDEAGGGDGPSDARALIDSLRTRVASGEILSADELMLLREDARKRLEESNPAEIEVE